jgi:isopentenyldiphosphate isomerase
VANGCVSQCVAVPKRLRKRQGCVLRRGHRLKAPLLRSIHGTAHCQEMTTAAPLDGAAEELLEEVDDANVLTGRLVPRSLAHTHGLVHRTVYVILTNAAGDALVLQQRHARKAVCPLLWDLTCAEHVAPGETYLQAAARGLREELGLEDGVELTELLPPTKRVLRWTTATGKQVLDVEFVPVLTGTLPLGHALVPDGVEVAAWKWQSWEALAGEAGSRPELFTPWLLDTLRLLGKLA